MADVFISYSRDDRETARTIAGALEAEGLSVWWDAALRAGEAYDEVTEANLRGAGAVVVLWSKRSTSSKWVRAEATVGERSSTLVPILIEECERPIRFELVQTADLRHWRGDRADPAWRAFMQDIRTALSKRAGKDPRTAAPAAVAATDSSVETTFWNSIKDGRERADFEAYLQRYPNGHFAALAQNRIATLARGGAQAAQARSQTQQPPQQKPQQQAARPAAQQQRPQPQPARAAGAAQARPAQQNPAPAKKSGGGLLIAGVLAALIIGGGVAAFMMMGGGGGTNATQTVAAATPSTPTDDGAIAADAAQTPPEEPAVDVLGDMSGAEESDDATIAALEAGSGSEASDVAVEEAAPQLAVAESKAPPATPSRPSSPTAAVTFTDCPTCPLMARLPGGTFKLGSPSDEPARNAYEGPQRDVTVKPFAIGVYEVTSAEWKACVDDGACTAKRADETGKLPALGLSWRDASSYVAWLSKKTGRKYRLPTEAEWEYAARAGSESAYWWGERFDSARVAKNGAAAVGSFGANAFGLYDVTGNAREWVADCYVNNFVKAPTDGSAVTDGDCGKRVVRGGYWGSPAADMRVANRSRIDSGVAASYMGVRVAASPD